ncbi:hypothetical protein [Pseudomonas serbica]|jgi:hypothetical protein|uniref:hypothetical protein n=1 Tax=Pseudomonas serbica TaxID=2965074 RepID=UPI00237BCAA2|nr:hypothetical protein [Pseudomonas serbica]
MTYITPKNLVHINDRLASLELYREVAMASSGDESIRASILAKIQMEEDAIRASYFERVEPNGSTRVRHPTIAVIEVRHDILTEPRRLFANKINSLVTYTLAVSQADAVIDLDGVIRYEPYAEVGRFTVSEQSFNSLLASTGGQSQPMNIESLQGWLIEAAIPDFFEASARTLGDQVDREIEARNRTLVGLIESLQERQTKGGKLPASEIEKLSRILDFPSTFVSNLCHSVGAIAEYAETVTSAQRLEIEALIRAHQLQEVK